MTDLSNLDIDMEFEFDEVKIDAPISAVADKKDCAIRFGIIGAGQCGGRLASAFQKAGYDKSIYINTTNQDTLDLPYSLIINIRNRITGGAGKNPIVSKAALEANKSKVTALMQDVFKTVDHIIICAGLGGGTGNGAVVPLIHIAHSYMDSLGNDDWPTKVSVIVSLPSRSELNSARIRANTASALKEIDALVQAKKIGFVAIIDNERAMNMYKNVALNDFYPKINNGLVQQLDVFNRIAAQNSRYVSLDTADFRDIIQTSGYLLIGSSLVEFKSDQLTISMTECLAKTPTVNPDDFDFDSAKKAGAIFAANQSILSSQVNLMHSLEIGYGHLMERAPNCVLHRGIYPIAVDRENKNGRVFVIMTGLNRPDSRFAKIWG